ncbi:hypothetical protein [Amycolatopsis albispora]|uniref:Uncharacterized protein n=1 Tax=Amycolatopsis albispora TaxID=1804986 RepID=A0A344L2Y4_9PSEU|nr:hypothetical protein [Amycolatopsis albispora]AXB42408.1 hypothetical protein A4R43_07600 [Amycolatopsis albispora]
MTSAREQAVARRLAAGADRRAAMEKATGVLCTWRVCGRALAREGLDDGQDGPLAEANRISAQIDARAHQGTDPELL